MLTEAEELELLELEEQEAMGQQSQPQTSQSDQPPTERTLGQNAQILGASAKAAWNNTPMANPERNISLAGMMVGTAIAPGIGTTIGAGLGQIASRGIGMATGKEELSTAQSPEFSKPSTWMNMESIAPMAQAGLAGVPEVGGVKKAIQDTAQYFGRRALGFTKPMLKRWNFGVNEANKVAQDMLDQGVITPASSQTMLDKATALSKQSGAQIGSTLKKAGTDILSTLEAADEVEKQLAPKFGAHVERYFKPSQSQKFPLFTEENVSGGAYDKTRRIVNEIENTIKSPGRRAPLSFEDAQSLKQKLGSLANFLKEAAPERSDLYRRAYGIVSEYIDKGLGKAVETGAISGKELSGFINAKNVFGSSRRAIEGLTDKAAAEASNSILSLRGAALGSGAIASGNIVQAANVLGAWEGGRRIGSATGSYLANSLNKSISGRALITQFVENRIHEDNQ